MPRKLFPLATAFLLTAAVWAQSPTTEKRETAVVVLSFISPVARESVASYDYRMHKNSREAKNYPLPLVALPEKAILYGKDGYAPLELAAAREHMKRIKAADFDLVFFDMLPIPDYDPAKPLTFTNEPFYYFSNYFEWMKAAEENHLKLGIFADVANQSARYPQYRNITKEEWIKILHGAMGMIPDSPAAWKVNGVNGIIHFGTDCVYSPKCAPVPGAPAPDGGWREVWKALREKGDRFFFISDIRPHNKDAAWGDLTDAAYMFAPAGPAKFMKEYQADISSRLKKIPFYWTVSCGYYRLNRDYTQPDFVRIHDTYLAALKAKASKVIVMTWNDLGEDHDIWPSANKGSELLDVIAFYNEYFKSGKQPEIKEDKLIVAYPLRAPAEVKAAAPAYSNKKWVSPEFTPKIFYWSALKQGMQTTVNGKTIRLPAGVSMGEIALEPGDDPAKIPVVAQLNDRTLYLPPVRKTAKEGDGGGLEHRYLNLLKTAAVETVGNNAVKWDISKDKKSTAAIDSGAGREVSVKFTAAKGEHSWIFLRNHIAEKAIPADARFVRLLWQGRIPAGMKPLCVLQEDGGVSYSCEIPLLQTENPQEIILPLGQFRRTGWSAPSPREIPAPAGIRIGHIGVSGTAGEKDLQGSFTVRQFGFLQ